MNTVKRFSFIILPSLYLYHLHKKSKIYAKEEPKIDQIKDLNKITFQNSIKSIENLKHPNQFNKSKEKAIKLAEAYRIRANVPGIVCAVSVKGKKIFSFGNGLADIEQATLMTEDCVMRIASISKSLTMLLLGKLIEEGKVDLDKSIYEYLGDKFPRKYFDGEKVDLTLRELVSHLGGIRHYAKKGEDLNKENPEEVYRNQLFKDVYDALSIFKDDELIYKPDDTELYSTYGYTLIQAVLESILDKETKDKNLKECKTKKFETELLKLCREIGMTSTFIDNNQQIIPNRCKYYDRNLDKSIRNCPEINTSYKIAGGGILSTVEDLLKFSNAMLYSYKTSNGILQMDTMKLLWTPNKKCNLNYFVNRVPVKYAMGFRSSLDKFNEPKYKGLDRDHFKNIVYHTGAAVGVTSICLILPDEEICIAIMANLKYYPGVSLDSLAFEIAKSVFKEINEINDLKSTY